MAERECMRANLIKQLFIKNAGLSLLAKNTNFSLLKKNAGLSLTELSIVITIIAILTGAIITGIKINKASELRNLMTNISIFQGSVENFRAKYSALPGDFADAYSYWQTDCADTDTKCNGNGDGKIQPSGVADDSEIYRAWQHLNLAGFIDGGYNGIGSGTGLQADIGVNVPRLARDDGGINLITIDSGDPENPIDKIAGTWFIAGGFLSNNLAINKFLEPAEAFLIDEQLDDGNPDSGKVRGRYYYDGVTFQNTTCLSGIYPNRSYNKTTTKPQCVLYFSLSF